MCQIQLKNQTNIDRVLVHFDKLNKTKYTDKTLVTFEKSMMGSNRTWLFAVQPLY